jgi:4-hydroxy-2-oxoheptanedioate aldolase
MYTSPEVKEMTDKLVASAKAKNIILGIFLFGTSRVKEFVNQGFTFVSIGNDLHHVMTQAEAHIKAVGRGEHRVQEVRDEVKQKQKQT